MKARRGLSSVVGMVFAIIALTSVMTYVSYSMNTLNQYNQSILAKNQQVISQTGEKFQITNFNLANNKLNITVANTGTVPINITKIWVQNTTAFGQGTDWTISYAPSNKIAGPGTTITNIGQSIPSTINPLQGYQIKLVTSRGNEQQFNINAANYSPLSLQLIATPSTIPTGFQTTVLLVVTNNSTNNAVLTNISPNVLGIVTNNGITSNCGSPSPASYSTIPVGTTSIFQWACTESGNVGSTITYNATLQNGYNHNYALTTVTIGNVQFAEQSQASISSSGLSGNNPNDNILNFHQEQNGVPNGGYQIWSGSIDNSTTKILQIDQKSAAFYTENDTTTETISAGKWNSTLRYMSAPVPTSLMSNLPNMIYHFEDYVSGNNNVGDSMGNENLTTSGSPTWSSTSGVNGSGAYTFAGSQYMNHKIDGQSNLNHQAGTISGWFKTSSQVSGTETIVRIGSQSNNPFYIVALDTGSNAGKLYFTFSDEKNGSPTDGTCETGSRYDDANWHFFVAVENPPSSGAACALYVDSYANVVTSGNNCASTCNQGVGGEWDVGRDPVNGNYFKGNIDDIMIWNSYSLTSTQVRDLRATSYGTNAQEVTFTVSLTDENGNNPSQLVQSVNYPLSFMDGWYKSPGQPWYTNNPTGTTKTWGHYNFTTNAVNHGQAVVVGSEQRLEFQMQFTTESYGQLGMQMIIDNTNINDQWGNSYLEIPTISSPLPGYYSYDAKSDGTVYVHNSSSGSGIVWLTPNSRVVFQTYDKSQAYGSWIHFGISFPYAVESDSLAIPAGASSGVAFSIPDTQPAIDGQQPPGCGCITIPAGNYRMYVYLNGYDENGNVILTTQYVGPVRVYIQ